MTSTGSHTQRAATALRAQWWLVLLCGAVMLWTAPGRIPYPDGEITYQTTAALVQRASLGIDGIPFRTGEPPDRPDGSFGVDGEAPDGRRYGFFGHALSVAAVPAYVVSLPFPDSVTSVWSRAPRRDLFVYHLRDDTEDWRRLVTSLTNVWICALLAWTTARWLVAVGIAWRPALLTGLLTVLGTFMWAYAATFMSEPLSALLLVASAASVARWRAGEGTPHAALAGALAGLAVHAHLLNLLALPCLLGYAVLPDRERWRRPEWRRDVALAVGLAAAGLVLLGVSHWLRFGSPWESGRFGHYGHWTSPWEGLAAQLWGPGRSLLLFCPALAVGLVGWPESWRRHRAELGLLLALLVVRLAVVSARSDWYGGWTLGPRYLAPVVPFAALPLAVALARCAQWPRWARTVAGAVLSLCVLVCGWLALHSSAEHMWLLMREYGVPQFYTRSHFAWADSPFVRYARLDAPAIAAAWQHGPRAGLAHNHWDVAWVGALRLRLAGHPGLWRLYLVDASIAALAGWRFAAALRGLSPSHRPK